MSLRIEFTRTGGFAGPAAQRNSAVDADALPEAEAKELRELVQQADLASLSGPTAAASRSVQPDALHYHLAVDVDGQSHRFEVSDRNMPQALRPLIKWLTKRALPGKS